MKLCNEEFNHYKAFHNNFEDVYIYKIPNGLYFVCTEPATDRGFEKWIFNGTRGEINGWLYGYVQANHKFVTARAEILI